MINWISNFLGTCAYSESLKGNDFKVVDVREMVDKQGNSSELIKEKIKFVLNLLKNNSRVVICCDYGMSRSNAIAVGVLSEFTNISFDEALRIVLAAVKEEIKLDVLKEIRNAVEGSPNLKQKINKKNILVLGGSGAIGQIAIPFLKLQANVFYPSRQELDLSLSPVHLDQFCQKNNITHILNLAYPRIFNTYFSFGESLGMLRSILEVIKNQNHIHLTYISSWVIFSGYASRHLIVDERVPPNPDGLYSENRYFCEKLIEYYLGKYNNLKIAIIRFSSCYGYGDKPKFIYNFINKAIANEDICTHEYINGLPYMHLTHMNDVSEFLKVWFSKDSKIGYFNIAGNDFLSTRAIAEKIILEIGSSSMIKTNNINTYTANIFLDTQKIQNYFEWNPKLSFDDILPELIKKAKNDILCEKEKI